MPGPPRTRPVPSRAVAGQPTFAPKGNTPTLRSQFEMHWLASHKYSCIYAGPAPTSPPSTVCASSRRLGVRSFLYKSQLGLFALFWV